MSESIKHLDISIMGREFRVACPADEEATLLQAVQLLDARMHDIRAAGKVIGIEKIADGGQNFLCKLLRIQNSTQIF